MKIKNDRENIKLEESEDEVQDTFQKVEQRPKKREIEKMVKLKDSLVHKFQTQISVPERKNRKTGGKGEVGYNLRIQGTCLVVKW